MRLLTKIGIGIFLCLSLFMLSCSIIRAAGTYYRDALDYPWQVFWLHSESCIGVTMASITVYRSTLVGSNEVSDKIQSYLYKLFGRRAASNSNTEHHEDGEKKTPNADILRLHIARPTLTGIRTMFGIKTDRTGTADMTATAGTVSTMDSSYGLMEMDYHAHIKAQAANCTVQTSERDTKSV